MAPSLPEASMPLEDEQHAALRLGPEPVVQLVEPSAISADELGAGASCRRAAEAVARVASREPRRLAGLAPAAGRAIRHRRQYRSSATTA